MHYLFTIKYKHIASVWEDKLLHFSAASSEAIEWMSDQAQNFALQQISHLRRKRALPWLVPRV